MKYKGKLSRDNKILLTRERGKKVDSIFKYNTEKGVCYSVHLKDCDEAIWCDNKWEVYLAIDSVL